MIPPSRYFFILLAVVVLASLATLLSISVIVSSSEKHIYKEVGDAPVTDVALVLGAAILRNGDLSPVLKDRADQAIALYEAEKVQKIIASGNSELPSYDEVQPMKNYFEKKGIPPEDIILDYAGFDTYSSIYRARDVFEARSIAIVSQSFHLPRAVFIARQLGMTAYGVSADRGHYKITNYFREMAADMKAVLNLITGRKPKYLEEDIPRNVEPEMNPKVIPLW